MSFTAAGLQKSTCHSAMCPNQIGGSVVRAEVGRTGALISKAESQEQTHLGLSSNPVAPIMLQWHCIHVAFEMNSQKASISSLFRASEFVLIGSFPALSRAAQGLLGQFARLYWPQPINRIHCFCH